MERASVGMAAITSPMRPSDPKRTSFDGPNRGSSSRRGTFAGIGTNESNRPLRPSQDGLRSPRADGSTEGLSQEQLVKVEAEKQKRRAKSMSQFSLTGACQV